MNSIIVGNRLINIDQIIHAEFTPAETILAHYDEEEGRDLEERNYPAKLLIVTTGLTIDTVDETSGAASKSDAICLRNEQAENVWRYFNEYQTDMAARL